MAIGSRNYSVYAYAGRHVPLLESIAGEIPVWFGWLALVPAIVALARRFSPFGPDAVRNAIVHLVAAAVSSGLVTIFIIVFRLLLENTPSPATWNLGFWSFALQAYTSVAFGFLFIYGSILGLALAWNYHVEQQQRREREARLQALLAETQRNLLRAQIHPHFLFNTMHSISALMGSDVAAARRMMTRLSDLLRLSLDEDAAQEVPLEEELELVDRYLGIQHIRFEDRLRVEQRIEPAAVGLLVPRLILQPLVENAILHAMAPLERPVTVTIEAAVVGGELLIAIRDDGPGPAPQIREGLGLSNSRSRLLQLYGEGATLTIEAQTPAGTAVRLRLPAHRRPVSEAVGVAR